jgi:hypothetical protein
MALAKIKPLRVAIVPAALIDVSNPNKIGTYPATAYPRTADNAENKRLSQT